MPFVDFVSSDDRVSLWYITNTLQGTVSEFDPRKPTIIMLHPIFLDSTWLNTQMEDPRLNDKFNIIAFDMRSCGRSYCKPSGAHDTWVDAADLAFAHLALGLPPCHIFAVENLSTNAALRFAALFPELCLSLTLVNVPPPTELEWVFEAYGELLNLWCHPQDLDEYEHACLELTQYMLGRECSHELRDQLIAYWSRMCPPWRRSRVYETMHCVLNRTPIQNEVLQSITQPTLIMQADRTEINPSRFADKLAKDLVNVKGRARVHLIKGSPEYVTLVPSCASIINRVFAEFLSRLKPHARSPSVLDPKTPDYRRERMEDALEQLAEFVGDASIADRDPCSPLSFSCVSPEVLQSQEDAIRRQQQDEHLAFSPLGMDGRPLRRYSERVDDHWFSSEDEDADTRTLVPLNKEEKILAIEKLVTQTEIHSTKDACAGHIAPTEPVSSEVARTGRLRRSTFTKNIVEKATIGGTSGAFAPTLIQNTLQLSRMKFTA